MSGTSALTQTLQSILNSFLDLCRCDGGTVYALEKNAQGQPVLRFKAMVTRSISVTAVPEALKRTEFAVDEQTIVGKTALFRKFVRKNDLNPVQVRSEVLEYETHTMLSAPLLTPRGELVGVVQLLNKLPGESQLDASVRAQFDERDESLIGIISGQAALAIENSVLLEEQEQLLDGFVEAFVTAVEARDPVTSGHSRRVCDLTVGLASAVNRETGGTLGGTQFSDRQIREIRFAAMLHDIGKVSVSENVLNKEKKLYPWELELLRMRIELMGAQLAIREKEQPTIEGRRLMIRLKKAWDEIRRANEPTILTEDLDGKLAELRAIEIQATDGGQIKLLSDEEFLRLSIKRGSLTAAERVEVEKHVTYTYEILKRVPWSRGLEGVPTIAYCHHEKLDGSGYPLKLPGEEIPIQGRMLAICDIYDALTADDRPYKRALPLDQALSIIESEVKTTKLDRELFRCFVEARVYELGAASAIKKPKAA